MLPRHGVGRSPMGHGRKSVPGEVADPDPPPGSAGEVRAGQNGTVAAQTAQRAPVRKPRALERMIVYGALLLVPATLVFHYRFLPFDDCLRHAAKAVSGKPWNEILVLRPDLTIDPHAGWHSVLSVLHRGLGLNETSLVVYAY